MLPMTSFGGQRLLPHALVVLASLLAVACVTLSTPLYFTLDMSTAPGNGAGYTVLEHRQVAVDTIRVTDKLVRRDLLIRVGETQIEFYRDTKWVARPSDLVAEKLATEFMPAVQAISHEVPTLMLHGELLAFEQVDAADGAVYAHIRLRAGLRPQGRGRHSAVHERLYEFLEPVPANGPMPKAVVEMLSYGLEVIAAEIAQDANRISLD
jgi:ABC-type uncharacterized transport system auxiliary subunit